MEKLGTFLQVLANVGILAGLVLVGIQINQSNQIAQANLVSAYYQQHQAFLISQMGEDAASARATAAVSPEALTPDQIQVLIHEAHWRVSVVEHNTIMEDLGMISSDWRAEIVEHAMRLGGTPVLREYFEGHCEVQTFAIDELCRLAAETEPGRLTKTLKKLANTGREYSASSVKAPPSEE